MASATLSKPALPAAAPRAPGRSGAAPFAGAALIVSAVASVALLMMHPSDGASHALADVLRAEAAQAPLDTLVHGGFIVVLVVQLIGLAALAVRAGPGRTAVLAAMTCALAGAALMAASMIVDGLMTPAVALRYAAAPADKQEAARGLLVLIGVAIGALMPIGLAMLGASALAWGAALTPTPGRARLVGVVGLVTGAAMLAGGILGFGAANPAPLMLALLAFAAWIAAAGALLAGWRT